MRGCGLVWAVGAMALLPCCLPETQAPSGEQILASSVPVRIPLYTADSRGPLFVLSGDATISDRRDWRDLHVFRSGSALPPPLSDRFLSRASLAFDRLFVALGDRVTDPPNVPDRIALGVLSPGLTETPWISMHAGFQSLSLSATAFVIQTSDAFVVGNALGRTRQFGAASLFQILADDRLYFRADDSKGLYRSAGPDAVPVPVDQDVRAFVVDRAGRFLSVHEDGKVFVGSDVGPTTPVSELQAGACEVAVLLEASAVVLCARLKPDERTLFTRIDLVTGRSSPIPGSGPVASFFEVTVRHDLAAAYFHYTDQTLMVDGVGNLVVIPFLISAPLFTADHTLAVYGTASRSGDTPLPTRFVVGSADFSGMPVPVGVESLIGYLDYGITEGRSGSHLVFLGESGTGSTHLYTSRLGTPPGPVRRLATAASVFELRGGRVLALVNLSSQDRTGHLVEYDLDRQTERRISAGVVDFASGRRCEGCGLHPEDQVAYLVRTRVRDPLEGLWVAPLSP